MRFPADENVDKPIGGEEMDAEQLIQKIWKKGKYRDRARPCPDEEIIASFTENLFGPERMEEVMGHIALYKICREKVILLHRIKEHECLEPILNPPEYVIQRAIDLVKRPTIADIVLRITQKAIQVLKNPANLDIPLIPVPVMRGKKSTRPNYITIRKNLEKFRLSVEVEKTLTGKIELRANIFSLDKECSVEGIRFSLISKVGLESYMTEGREVVFQDVLPGLSTLEIAQGEKRIGEMSIEIKDEDHG